MDLVESIYRVSAAFPADERFGLTAQIRRAAVSVPSNLAEGNRRGTQTDKLRFIIMAHGSAAEVETHLEIAIRLQFIVRETAEDLLGQLDHLSRMLTNVRKNVRV
jgi:four helix bundle protein